MPYGFTMLEDFTRVNAESACALKGLPTPPSRVQIKLVSLYRSSIFRMVSKSETFSFQQKTNSRPASAPRSRDLNKNLKPKPQPAKTVKSEAGDERTQLQKNSQVRVIVRQVNNSCIAKVAKSRIALVS